MRSATKELHEGLVWRTRLNELCRLLDRSEHRANA
jgi:hypothetical protein